MVLETESECAGVRAKGCCPFGAGPLRTKRIRGGETSLFQFRTQADIFVSNRLCILKAAEP
jgi:hypothetical protein